MYIGGPKRELLVGCCQQVGGGLVAIWWGGWCWQGRRDEICRNIFVYLCTSNVYYAFYQTRFFFKMLRYLDIIDLYTGL